MILFPATFLIALTVSEKVRTSSSSTARAASPPPAIRQKSPETSGKNSS